MGGACGRCAAAEFDLHRRRRAADPREQVCLRDRHPRARGGEFEQHAALVEARVQQPVVEKRRLALAHGFYRFGLQRRPRARQQRACRIRDGLQIARGKRGAQTIEQLARCMHRDAPGKPLLDDGSV